MIRAIFFDLDNTLYPASASMEDDIVQRMNEYVARLLRMPFAEAKALRALRMPNYGTTLEWLMHEHALAEIEDYFCSVHPEGEEEVLVRDPDLPAFLDSMSQEKFIFTNAPSEHAVRVLEKLGIAGKFRRIFDVRFTQLQGKPARSAVEKVLAASGYQAAETLFVDDVPRYVRGFTDCGGKGVLIDHHDRYPQESLPRIRTIYELKNHL